MNEHPMPLPALLVGAGHAGQRHADALRAAPARFTLCGVCDPDVSRAESLARKASTTPYRTLGQALEHTAPALVILTTPSGLHAGGALEAARAGCAVLVEKPLAMGRAQAEEVRRACADAGVELFVMHQLRAAAGVRALTDALAGGVLGDVHTVGIQLWLQRPQTYYDAASWRGSRTLDGGVLWNQTIHHLDLLAMWFGPPTHVHGAQVTLGRDIEAPDTAALLLQWPTLLATVHATTLAAPRTLASRIDVLGTHGMIGLEGARIVRWESSTEIRTPKRTSHAPEPLHERVYASIHTHLTAPTSPRPTLLQLSPALDAITILDRLAARP